MHASDDTGELEIVRIRRGRQVRRWKAYEQGESLPLVCATLPIIGTDEIVELLRSPQKRVMGGEWIFFLSEHRKAGDDSARSALARGLKEELSYVARNGFFDPDEQMDLSYLDTQSKLYLRWKAYPYVVPIRSLSDLTPDGKEILKVRARPIDEVIRDVYRKNSPYGHFSPESFLKALEKHTRHIMDNINPNY